ncbi:hypothetical protein SAMN05444375_107100 [Segatella baroniae B14]|jgi:hypothetical protein|nr:hypothetical protein SAMN04487899_104156 [Segatella bryantii]SDZ80830.1 hypothetical protein SAMN05216455_101355 [Segatella bryantii]SEQ28437.1 hypothetical protein SAMN05444375_107100 [Segatella baroniae B14]
MKLFSSYSIFPISHTTVRTDPHTAVIRIIYTFDFIAFDSPKHRYYKVKTL